MPSTEQRDLRTLLRDRHQWVKIRSRLQHTLQAIALNHALRQATLHAVGKDPELKRFYRRKLIQKGMGKARIAVARKPGIRLWIMMRDQINYEKFCRRGKLRQRGKPMRGCLISTVVLHGSDRVN
jgi:hypothetical protein